MFWFENEAGHPLAQIPQTTLLQKNSAAFSCLAKAVQLEQSQIIVRGQEWKLVHHLAKFYYS